MKKDIFAVCDTEVSYVLRLMEFIQQKQGAIFEVQAFTNVKSLCEFAEKQKISLLLISARAMCQEVRALPALISISLRAVRPVIHLRSGPIFSLFRLILVSCVRLARGDISVTLLASSSK